MNRIQDYSQQEHWTGTFWTVNSEQEQEQEFFNKNICNKDREQR